MKWTRISVLTLLLAAFVLALPVAAQDTTTDLQTYTPEDGRASVQFPADWVSEEGYDSDSVLTLKVANSPDALEKELFNLDDVFESGEVHIEVAAIALAELASDIPDDLITTTSTPTDILDALTSQGMPDEFEFGDSGEIKVNGIPAVRVNLIAAERGEGQLLLTVIDQQWVIAIILYAAPGEGDKWDIIARDILGSVTITEPTPNPDQTPEPDTTAEPISLTNTASNGVGMLMYPDTWFSREYGNDGIYIANSEAALEKSFGDAIISGEANILVSFGTVEDYMQDVNLPPTLNVSPLQLLQATTQVVGDSVTFTDIETTFIGDHPAARVDFSTPDFAGTAWLVTDDNERLITIQLLAAVGEVEQWQQTALYIAQTAAFAPQ